MCTVSRSSNVQEGSQTLSIKCRCEVFSGECHGLCCQFHVTDSVPLWYLVWEVLAFADKIRAASR